jgi:hypothetical protein
MPTPSPRRAHPALRRELALADRAFDAIALTVLSGHPYNRDHLKAIMQRRDLLLQRLEAAETGAGAAAGPECSGTAAR